ncbi:MAG: helix-hairpin-helix domain-containing protein [Candidatus Helarchaeota archaeon]
MSKSKRVKQVETTIIEEDVKVPLIPVIHSPSRFPKPRIGKGFSLNEIKNSSVPLDEILKMKLPIDKRRKTIHQENIEYLGKKFREIMKEREVRLEELKKIEKRIKENIKTLSKKLSGISKKEIKILIDGGVKSVEQLAEEDPKILAKDLGEPVQKVVKWVKEAKKSLIEIKYEEAIKELKKIDISIHNAKRMASLGIINLEILADEKVKELSKDMGVNENIAKSWIEKAQSITGKKAKKDIERGAPIGKVSKKVVAKEISLDDIMNKKEVNKLKDLGIESLENLAEEDPIELSSILGYNKNKVLTWINEARRLLGKNLKSFEKKKKHAEIKIEKMDVELELDEEPDEDVSINVKDFIKELMKVKGLGKTSAEKIANEGKIKTMEEFKNVDVSDLAKKTGISEKKLIKFIEEVKKL